MNDFRKTYRGEIPILCGLILIATLVITQINAPRSDSGPNPTLDIEAMEANHSTDSLNPLLMSDLVISDSRIH